MRCQMGVPACSPPPRCPCLVPRGAGAALLMVVLVLYTRAPWGQRLWDIQSAKVTQYAITHGLGRAQTTTGPSGSGAGRTGRPRGGAAARTVRRGPWPPAPSVLLAAPDTGPARRMGAGPCHARGPAVGPAHAVLLTPGASGRPPRVATGIPDARPGAKPCLTTTSHRRLPSSAPNTRPCTRLHGVAWAAAGLLAVSLTGLATRGRWGAQGRPSPLRPVALPGPPCRSAGLGGLAARVWALRRGWGGLTATDSDVGCGRALLSDGRDGAMCCPAVHRMGATLSQCLFPGPTVAASPGPDPRPGTRTAGGWWAVLQDPRRKSGSMPASRAEAEAAVASWAAGCGTVPGIRAPVRPPSSVRDRARPLPCAHRRAAASVALCASRGPTPGGAPGAAPAPRSALDRDGAVARALEARYLAAQHNGTFSCRWHADPYAPHAQSPAHMSAAKVATRRLFACAVAAAAAPRSPAAHPRAPGAPAAAPPAPARVLVLEDATGRTLEALGAVGVGPSRVLVPCRSTAVAHRLRRRGARAWAGDVAAYLALPPPPPAPPAAAPGPGHIPSPTPLTGVWLDHTGSVRGREAQLHDALRNRRVGPGGVLAATFSLRGSREGWSGAEAILRTAAVLVEAAAAAEVRLCGAAAGGIAGAAAAHAMLQDLVCVQLPGAACFAFDAAEVAAEECRVAHSDPPGVARAQASEEPGHDDPSEVARRLREWARAPGPRTLVGTKGARRRRRDAAALAERALECPTAAQGLRGELCEAWAAAWAGDQQVRRALRAAARLRAGTGTGWAGHLAARPEARSGATVTRCPRCILPYRDPGTSGMCFFLFTVAEPADRPLAGAPPAL